MEREAFQLQSKFLTIVPTLDPTTGDPCAEGCRPVCCSSC